MDFPLISGALAILLCVLGGIFFFHHHLTTTPVEKASSTPDIKTPDQAIKYWRIRGIPENCTKENLISCLQSFDQSLKFEHSDLSLYSGCYGRAQTALLKLKGLPDTFRRFTPNGSDYYGIPDVSSEEKLDLSVDHNFYDFTPLNNPEGENIVDVIAVTGLAGHAFGSWRNRDSGKMWLKDFLPKHVKNIRILTYGYNTNLIGDTVDDSVLDYRGHLLEQLDNSRSSAEEKHRPIIFIGHSFGGILILQALLQSKVKAEFKHILESTRAMFFFGVPHQGIRTTELEAMVRDLEQVQDSPRLKLLQQLQRDSNFLIEQKNMLSEIWSELKVYSFYEKAKTRTVQRTAIGRYEATGKEEETVNRFSSQLFLPTEHQIGVQKNHREMVKFQMEEDPTYITLKKYLSNEVDKSVKLLEKENKPVISARNEHENGCLHTLGASDYQSKRDELLQKRTPDTCGWIVDDEQYKSWMTNEEPTLLQITGGPGWGKSVLSAFLSKQLASDPTVPGEQGCLVAYFFCNDTDERLRAATAILQDLLDQLLREEPMFFCHIMPEYMIKEKKTLWTFGRLWRVFTDIIANNSSRRIIFLIDALDECEERSRERFLELLAGFLPELQDPPRNFRMIITSRPHIQFPTRLEKFTEILLLTTDKTASDIEEYVDNQLEQLARKNLDDKLKLEIRQTLIEGADGMFLWVSLLFIHLREFPSTSPNRLREQLKKFPKTLPGVYWKILNAIKGEFREDAHRVLQWVVYTMRPLTLEELRVAIAIKPYHTSISSMQEDVEGDLEQYLNQLFGPLLRIEDSTVHLVHQSAKDFLINIDSMKGSPDFPNWSISPTGSHLQIAITCQFFFLFEEYAHFELPDQVIRFPFDKYPLLDYATTYWPEHVRQADQEDPNLLDSFWNLVQSKTNMEFIFQLYVSENNINVLEFHSPQHIGNNTPPLQISALLGLPVFMNYLLRKGHDINMGGTLTNALCVGVRFANESVVELLLENNARISASTLEFALGSSTAKINGMLLDHLESTNFSGKDKDLEQNKNIVNSELSEVTNIVLNRGNWIQSTEFSFSRGKVEITEAMIVAAASNKRDGKEVLEVLFGRGSVEITEAVMVAAAENRREVMEVLLGIGSVEITEAVMVAAAGNRWSGEEVLEVLLSIGSVKITEGVMVVAAGNIWGKKEVLELLLSRGSVEITEAVMVVAARNERSGKEVLEVLLSRGNVEITEAVMVAAAGNHWSGKEVLEVLLGRGSVEITEAVMVAAAKNERSGKEVLEVLLSKGNVEITEAVMVAVARNIRDGKKVLEVLLSRGNVEITEAVMVAAAVNRWSGKEVLEVLLGRGNVEITEAVMVAVARNIRDGKKVLEVLLSRGNVEITEAVMVAAAGNRWSGKEVLEVLLGRGSVEITEAVMVAAAGNRREVMEVLLSIGSVDITEAVMVAAAGNPRGREVLEVLLGRGNVEITEAVMVAAANNWNGKGVLELLLGIGGTEITEAVMVAAAGNPRGREVLEFLLSIGSVEITEAVMLAAVGNDFSGKKVLKVLLSRGNVEITEAVMVAAASNDGYRKEVLEVLLGIGSVEITEAVMVAAAKNERSGKEVLEVLLSRGNVEITEAVMVAVARNIRDGKKVLEVLLSRGNVEITEAVMVAAAGNHWSGKEVLEVLLGRGSVEITEAVMVAAAGNLREVLELLLGIDGTEITEAVMVAAANNWSGKGVLELLLGIGGTEITEAVMVAAAGNHWSGKKMLELLLGIGSVEITEAVMLAAVGNDFSGKEVLEVLLGRGNVEITEAVMVAAAGNDGCGKELIRLLKKQVCKMGEPVGGSLRGA